MRFGSVAVAFAGVTFALIGCGDGAGSGGGGGTGGTTIGGGGTKGGSGGRGGSTAGASGAGGVAGSTGGAAGGAAGAGGATAGASGGGLAGAGASAGGSGGATGGSGGATGGRGGAAGAGGATGGSGGATGGRGGAAGAGGATGGSGGATGGRGGAAGAGGATGGTGGATGGRGGAAGSGGATGGTGGVAGGAGFPDCSLGGSGGRSPRTLSFAATDYKIPSPAVGPNAVAISDLNADGKPDLAVADFGNAFVSVFLNNGNGTFNAGANYSSGGGTISVTAADLNGDGRPDLAVPNACFGGLSILLNAGDGTFGYFTKHYLTSDNCPTSLAAGDFDRDGKMDLVVTEGDSADQNTGVNVFRGNGDGTVTPGITQKAGVSPYAVAAADLNADGRLDLAIGHTGQGITGKGVSVMLGNGDGTFAPPVLHPTGSTSNSMVTIGDVNGDGRPDIVASCPSPSSATPGGSVQVLINAGNGSFSAPVRYDPGGATYGPNSVAIGDVNGDCWPDLVVDNLGAGGITVIINRGNGVFGDPVNFPFTGQSVAIGDLDVDGRPDIAIAKYSGTGFVTVLLNTSR